MEKSNKFWVNKTFLKTCSIITLFLITGCGSNQTGQDSTSAGTDSVIEANYVCQNVGDIVTAYDDYISLWRNAANNVPYDELFTYSDEVSTKLHTLADQISTNGIDWDSGAIISSFIMNVADDIDEISSSTQQGYFPPGRDLNALLGDKSFNANAVLKSACK